MSVGKVFDTYEGNEGDVDLSKPLNVQNSIPVMHDSPQLLHRQLRILNEMRNVLFIITRSKNSNAVVYRFKPDSDPIEVFWQRFAEASENFTSEYELREELTWIQKKMAYGINCRRIPGSDNFQATLTACPHLLMRLTRDKFNIPRLEVRISDRDCYLLRIYVEARENMIGFPTVIFTNIHAIEICTGREIVAKLKP